MHINNKSTNGTTLNLTIKLHAQYKITVWTTCTYKSHTDTWNATNLTTVLWLIASKSDDVTLRPLNWRRSDGTNCCYLTLLERCARTVPKISCALESLAPVGPVATVREMSWRCPVYCKMRDTTCAKIDRLLKMMAVTVILSRICTFSWKAAFR